MECYSEYSFNLRAVIIFVIDWDPRSFSTYGHNISEFHNLLNMIICLLVFKHGSITLSLEGDFRTWNMLVGTSCLAAEVITSLKLCYDVHGDEVQS